jgi:hypothetical protein
LLAGQERPDAVGVAKDEETGLEDENTAELVPEVEVLEYGEVGRLLAED